MASDLPAAEAAVELRAPAVPAPTADELVALDELPGAGPWEVFGHRLWLTNLDKVLFPGRPGEEPLTKRELARSDFASPERLRQPGATSPARSDFASPERLRQPGATSPARSDFASPEQLAANCSDVDLPTPAVSAAALLAHPRPHQEPPLVASRDSDLLK